jgi:O-antigen/teichoic acid export membrane protein
MEPHNRYLQAQNLMNIPTYILFVVAPLNLVLNWLLVSRPSIRSVSELTLCRFGVRMRSDWASLVVRWALLLATP